MSTISIANHISVINSCAPPKFNHHNKQQWLASPVIMCHYFMKHSAMHVRSTDFYKTEKFGEKDHSTGLYITQVNLNVHKNYPEYIPC